MFFYYFFLLIVSELDLQNEDKVILALNDQNQHVYINSPQLTHNGVSLYNNPSFNNYIDDKISMENKPIPSKYEYIHIKIKKKKRPEIIKIDNTFYLANK